MANVRDYINENLDEAVIGNVDLNKLASRANELAQKVPTGAGLNNRLAKAGEKELAAKLMQAQKLKEEMKGLKTRIAPLKDADASGRKAVKQGLERVIKGLEKLQGLEGQAEKALAAKASTGQAKASQERVAAKKKDFKDRVKANLDRKKAGRIEKVKSAVGKAKAKARHSLAAFKN